MIDDSDTTTSSSNSNSNGDGQDKNDSLHPAFQNIPPHYQYQGKPQPNCDINAKKFRLSRAKDFMADISGPDWLVDNYLERNTIGEIYADPGTCKTFFTIYISGCVALGIPLFDNDVVKSLVIYICGEGNNGFKRRLKGLCIQHGIDEIPNLYVSNTSIQLFNIDQLLILEQEIDRIAAETGENPGLIVIDTYARNFGGSENSNDDVSKFIAHLDYIRAKYQSTIILVHHKGHGDKTRSRGASALAAACDFRFEINKEPEDRTFTVKCVKQKDADDSPTIGFKAVEQQLDITDKHGNLATTLIIERNDSFNAPTKVSSLTNQEAKGLALLEQLYIEHRNNKIQGGYDPDEAKVLIKDWQKRCLTENLFTSWDRRYFSSLKKSLEDKGAIIVDSPFAVPRKMSC